jgi:hypothetical protein
MKIFIINGRESSIEYYTKEKENVEKITMHRSRYLYWTSVQNCSSWRSGKNRLLNCSILTVSDENLFTTRPIYKRIKYIQCFLKMNESINIFLERFIAMTYRCDVKEWYRCRKNTLEKFLMNDLRGLHSSVSKKKSSKKRENLKQNETDIHYTVHWKTTLRI